MPGTGMGTGGNEQVYLMKPVPQEVFDPGQYMKNYWCEALCYMALSREIRGLT